LRCHDARGAAVIEDLVGPPLALLLWMADSDQRHIAESIGRHRALRLGSPLAVGLEDRRGAHPAGVEHADGHPALGRLHRTAWAADRHPQRRMRLLPRPGPNIDRAV